mmetsp:Transcript_48531/g.55815  ORF Transcript_48531/g.55815 Transcript_48531/m.55815 type:complete len:451 (+) Transcript_48531:3-1355(+)
MSSQASKLYDPLLHRKIHRYMQKIFMKLILEFKKLGSTIVYASFTKIILCTHRQTDFEARSYTEYVIQTLGGNPLFQYVHLNVAKFWTSLLFKDLKNYGGLNPEEEGREIESTWNIAQYLPPAVEVQFQSIVGEFIYKPYLKKVNLLAELEERMVGPSEREEIVKKAHMDYLKLLISSHFTKKMISFIPDLKRRKGADDLLEEEEEFEDEDFLDQKQYYDEDDEEDESYRMEERRRRAEAKKERLRKLWEFPSGPGSYIDMVSPPLEFINMVCHIMSLEKSVNAEVFTLKENALRMINIGAFTSEAQYREPCATYILRNVICNFCLKAKDLDLCRDSALLQSDWKCEVCHHEYSKSGIEFKIIESFKKRLINFQLQELRCKKCSMNKADLLKLSCTCSGGYEFQPSDDVYDTKESIRTTMHVLRNIADFHEMVFLKDVVDSVIEYPTLTQ